MDHEGFQPSISFSLFNPAFCSFLIASAVKEYELKKNQGMPFSLSYLLLPIIFNPRDRATIKSHKKMIAWIDENPDSLISFGKSCNGFIDITNQAIAFSFDLGTLFLDHGLLSTCSEPSQSKRKAFLEKDLEIKDCYDTARILGRWFSEISENMIYRLWRIRP